MFQCSLKRHQRVDPPKEEFADGGLKLLVACLCSARNWHFEIIFWCGFVLDEFFVLLLNRTGGKRCTVAGDNFEAFFKRTDDTATKWVKKELVAFR